MSCCPKPQSVSKNTSNVSTVLGQDPVINPRENIDCYMNRTGNSTDSHDDATEEVPSAISNTAIPLIRSKTSVQINTQFKLTLNSNRTATSWSMECDPSSSMVLSNSGLLTANFTASSPDLNKTFDIIITASDSSGEIDSRGFTVSPDLPEDGDELKFISPLPGGIINSPYGPRMHPIKHVMKQHTGIDMKMPDRSVRDVVACADGEIISVNGSASDTSGYGLRIHIKHVSASGSHICTSTYNHLARSYVSIGQKVMAGQKIGLEGTSGGSTGNHLHFEIIIPGHGFTDPAPYISGATMKVRGNSIRSQDPVNPADLEPSTPNGSISKKEAASKSCAPYGPSYPPESPAIPSTPAPVAPAPAPLPPVPSAEVVFERAWFFTMKSEVSPAWNENSKNDPEIAAGLIQTAQQRKKVGYVNWEHGLGGVTKFGIAQRFNTNVDVNTMSYEVARNIGYNKYWGSGISCENKSMRVAIMLFDMKYLNGPSGAAGMYNSAGITSAPTDSKELQLQHCEILRKIRVERANTNQKLKNGWTNRANACFAYIQSL